FQDNFERGDLDQWVAKGSSHHGQIVPDPLDPTGTNHALNFTARNSGGDIFTGSAIDISGVTGTIVLSFDYLGLADGDPDPNNLGGFIGVSTNRTPSNGGVDHFWLAATDPSAAFSGYGYNAEPLIDDGTWHHYDLDFTNIFQSANLQSIYI